MDFLDIRFLDIIDILLVSFLLYQFYFLIKGTNAISIFVGIFSVYMFWLLVRALNMQLLSSILGQFMGVGVIALIIVFQQEIRGFLLLLGGKYFTNKTFSIENLFSAFIHEKVSKLKISSIVVACENMSKTKTGALIVIARNSDMFTYAQTGDIINATTYSRLLETIFFKNTPLHDGAIIIQGEKIHAARCVLPVSDSSTLPKTLGLRHRAALGISERTDAFVIVVSEETGKIAIAQTGEMTMNVTPQKLRYMLDKEFMKEKGKPKEGKLSQPIAEVDE